MISRRLLLAAALAACSDDPREIVECAGGFYGGCERICADITAPEPRPKHDGPACETALGGCMRTTTIDGVQGCCIVDELQSNDPNDWLVRFAECE